MRRTPHLFVLAVFTIILLFSSSVPAMGNGASDSEGHELQGENVSFSVEPHLDHLKIKDYRYHVGEKSYEIFSEVRISAGTFDIDIPISPPNFEQYDYNLSSDDIDLQIKDVQNSSFMIDSKTVKLDIVITLSQDVELGSWDQEGNLTLGFDDGFKVELDLSHDYKIVNQKSTKQIIVELDPENTFRSAVSQIKEAVGERINIPHIFGSVEVDKTGEVQKTGFENGIRFEKKGSGENKLNFNFEGELNSSNIIKLNVSREFISRSSSELKVSLDGKDIQKIEAEDIFTENKTGYHVSYSKDKATIYLRMDVDDDQQHDLQVYEDVESASPQETQQISKTLGVLVGGIVVVLGAVLLFNKHR